MAHASQTRRVPRTGFHSVTPRLVVVDVAWQAEFLRRVFDAVGTVVAGQPVEMRIGDSLIMISETDEREMFPAFLYIYVDDADKVCQRAVSAGATVIEHPFDTPYGDRRGMVQDPLGNVFQVAHVI
ncbi:MAG: PhnB protein [Acidimicrobiales bacterium]|jgi:PhnB protein